MNFDQALEYLLQLGHETLAMKLGLRNTELLLQALGNPEQSYPAVQIAGTNGKGSTAVMTIWDTYGKLIGLNRTPSDLKKKMARLNSNGAYLIYASVESSAIDHLPAKHFLACGDSNDESFETADLTFATSAVASVSGKTAVTVKVNCPVNDWFTFQSSLEDFETWDQEALERVWSRLHRAVPELGDSIEIIETANPRTFYDDTRRKLGMVLGVEQTPEALSLGPETTLPNVFMVGDTACSVGVAAVATGAAHLAQQVLR